MAQQITIDIVAETKKLASGINDANNQIEGMNSKLKGVVAAAGAAASAFVLKQGVTFLKQGIDEAKEAQETMQKANTTFGEGSVALAKITSDAEKFGKAIAVDNDEIIQLSTQLGSRLPADVRALSAELINTGYDVEAFTAGAITAEAFSSKLAKAFTDGVLTAKELSKIFPGLTAATLAQAETLSKAGKNQDALNLLIGAAQKQYGDAAEKNVTATQKFETALANLKETVGTKILPILEKVTSVLTTIIDAFSSLPGPVQNVILAVTALVGVGGPLLGFLASAKTSMATLGLISSSSAGGIGAATIATNLLSVAMRALPILAIIGLIVLLVKNWDTVKIVVDKVWNAIKDFAVNAWNALSSFSEKVVGFVAKIINAYLSLPEEMVKIGINIVKGLWEGMSNMLGWLQDKLTNSLVGKTISKIAGLFGIKSPSTVFAEMGKNLVLGLVQGVDNAQKFVSQSMVGLADTTTGSYMPSLAYAGSSMGNAPIQITINAGLGTDPYQLGREVNTALTKYGKVSSRVVRG